jgi:hypothetical protein
LHPLDFLDPAEAPDLAFFPGMRVSLQHKLDLAAFALSCISRRYRPVTLEEYAALAAPLRDSLKSATVRVVSNATGTTREETRIRGGWIP